MKAGRDTLVEQRRVEKVILRFARGLDDKDWNAYRSCFAPTIAVDFEQAIGRPEVCVAADDWVRLAELRLAPIMAHHGYSNIDVDFADGRAAANVYFVARHWRADPNSDDAFTEYGWYDFGFVLERTEWLIDRVALTIQRMDGNPEMLDNGGDEYDALVARIWSAAGPTADPNSTLAGPANLSVLTGD
jgi:hypothetical protein